MTQQINRRTVTKGIAWSVPVVALAGASPAFASSGQRPTAEYVSACKLPGNSCGLDKDNKTYVFRFKVTNNDPDRDIYFCKPTMKRVSGSPTGDWIATSPADGGSCYTVPKGETRTINFRFENSSNSGNLTFVADVTIPWSHTCPCSDDPNYPFGPDGSTRLGEPPVHQPLYTQIRVLKTKPQDCPCGAYGNTEMRTASGTSLSAPAAVDSESPAPAAEEPPVEEATTEVTEEATTEATEEATTAEATEEVAEPTE